MHRNLIKVLVQDQEEQIHEFFTYFDRLDPMDADMNHSEELLPRFGWDPNSIKDLVESGEWISHKELR